MNNITYLKVQCSFICTNRVSKSFKSLNNENYKSFVKYFKTSLDIFQNFPDFFMNILK